MELFRVNGMSSEDLLRPGQNPTKAFLGHMFKIGEPAPEPAARSTPYEIIGEGEIDVQFDGQPDDSGQAQPDIGDDHRWTAKELLALSKEKLVELGSALGVADLDQTKPKLVDAILAVQ